MKIDITCSFLKHGTHLLHERLILPEEKIILKLGQRIIFQIPSFFSGPKSEKLDTLTACIRLKDILISVPINVNSLNNF